MTIARAPLQDQLADKAGLVWVPWARWFEALRVAVNLLVSLEVGTFTPTLAGATTAGTQTYTTQIGRYVRVYVPSIGFVILFALRVAIATKDGATLGTLRIEGLPYTVENEGLNYRILAMYSAIDLNVAGAMYSPSAAAQVNTTRILLQEQGDNVANANLTEADFANGSAIDLVGWYRAAA